MELLLAGNPAKIKTDNSWQVFYSAEGPRQEGATRISHQARNHLN